MNRQIYCALLCLGYSIAACASDYADKHVEIVVVRTTHNHKDTVLVKRKVPYETIVTSISKQVGPHYSKEALIEYLSFCHHHNPHELQDACKAVMGQADRMRLIDFAEKAQTFVHPFAAHNRAESRLVQPPQQASATLLGRCCWAICAFFGCKK